MESKKINQLATELTPALSDLTIIGDPTTGISKKITLSQMASLFTGTVEEYANLAAFPLVGTADTIYIALDTNVLYRWDTTLTSYVELSPNIVTSLVFSDANGFDGNISLVGSVATLTITTALTTGSVPFIGASGALSQDNANLFFDDTNNRLGINTNAPTTALDVFGSGIIGRLNGTSTNNAFLGFASAGSNKWSIGNVQSDHRFRIYSEANTSELVSVLQTGEVGIGIVNPTTKLHIDGGASALIANLDANVSVAKSISFRSDNSARINLEVSGTESGSNAGADLFIRRYSDAGALIDTALYLQRSTGNIGINTTSPNEIAAGNIHLDIRSSSYSFLQVGTSSTATSSDVGYLEFMNGNNKRLGTIAGGADGTALAGYMRFSTANSSGNFTERMRITSNGLVGINTNTPNVLLEVKGGSAMTTLANSYTNAGFIHQYNSTNILALGSNGSSMIIQGVNAGTNGAVPLLLQPFGGFVGIGTTSPTRQLFVNSTAFFDNNGDGTTTNPSIAIGSTNVGLSYIAGGNLSLLTGGTERLRITSAGIVQIGSGTYTDANGGLALKGSGGSPYISWHADNGTRLGYIQMQTSGIASFASNSSGQGLAFEVNGAERFRVTSGGEILMHSTSFNSTLIGQLFGTGGDTYFTTETGQILYLNRKGNDGTLVDFRRDNSVKGTISVSGETVSYNSFLGSHWSQLLDNSKPEILKGTILETIDELCIWENEINDRLPKVKISNTIESKKVYGIFLAWDNDDIENNDMYVAAVGAGYIRINKNEIISMGDLLQSNGDGTAKVQSDDIMRSSTIAKVISTNKIETYEDGSYLIAATLHCG